GAKSEECHGRSVEMRRHGNVVHDAVPSVPVALKAGAIEEHGDSESDPIRDPTRSAARETLSESEQGKGCRHDPASGVGLPRPAEFTRVKTDMGICGPELPLPQPVSLSSPGSKQPFDAWRNTVGLSQRVESQYRQSGEPAR